MDIINSLLTKKFLTKKKSHLLNLHFQFNGGMKLAVLLVDPVATLEVTRNR